ncbi:hypothetical protein CSIV_14225 [Microbacterium sp. CSI-V]|uniref:hypothetical protein n=1 Tax=Microbacterium sp. CSI-V TaxID=1933777 RepID=UPI00097CAF7F|nr:hypothetical protein [Microbacterium sp. CSI-V]ONI62628.1 hypothetical protein CSIV_14225 [Microbacterium sp. CSI-V]
MSGARGKAASATPDAAEQAAAEQAAAEQAAAEQAAAEQAAAEQAAAEGEVRVQMLVAITGTRDGEKWPAVGGVISLPADEAAGYIANGYATPTE